MASELVRFNGLTKKFEVPAEASRLLRSLTGPVCVIAVCGRARQGKSFLLNQLLAKLQGQAGSSSIRGRFTVGNSFKPCTKGLWLWSHPIPRTLPNGQPFHMLLVDAEGIDAYDQTADYSNYIFSLALLLSSLLVYNQMGSIDESSVDKLASVCQFARLIRGRTAPSTSDAELLRDLSPAFIWLLRDYQFQMTQDGRQMSVRDYMEEVLQEQPGTSEAVRGKNELRSTIKAVFPDRDCHALVRPMLDEAALSRMDSLDPAGLRPEFKRGLDALVELLLARCRPKTLHTSGGGGGSAGGGCLLTGPALAGLAEAYCRVINEGRVPAITSTWQSVVQSECRRALDAASDLYRARLEAARGAADVGAEELQAAHAAALAAATELFNKQAVGEAGERESFLRRLREVAATALAPLLQAKRAQAEARLTQMLVAGSNQFLQAVRTEGSDLAAAESRLLAFLQGLATDKALGPEKYIKAAELLAGTVLPELRTLAQTCRSKAVAAERRAGEAEAKVTDLTRRTQELRASLDSLTAAEAQLRRDLATAQAAASAAAARLAAAEVRGDGSSREMTALREQLATARVEAARGAESAAEEATRLRSELALAQSQRKAAEARAQQATAARGAAAHQAAARDAEVEARTAEAVTARREAEALRAEQARLRRQLEEASSHLATRDATLSNLQRERDFMQAQLDEQKRRLQGQEVRLAAAAAAPGGALAAAGRPQQSPWQPGAAGEVGGAGGGGSGCAGSNRKRDRAAAGLPQGSRTEEDDDVMMFDAEEGPAVVDMTGDDDEEGRGTAEGWGMAAAGTGAGGPTEPPTGRRRVTPVKSADRRRRSAAAGPGEMSTPVAMAGGAAAVPTTGHARTPVVVGTTATGAAGTAAGATPVGVAAAGRRTVAGGPYRTPAAAAGGAGGSGVGGERSPFSNEREVVRRAARTTPGGSAAQAAQAQGGAAVAGAVAASTTARPPLPPNIDTMKIIELKDFLVQNDMGLEVVELNKRKPTRPDWVALVRSKCEPR